MNISIPIGAILNNDDIVNIFKCSTQGGMRKSNKTNTLVLTSDKTSVYHDRWEGDILHYTGMGQTGDQNINFSQNKTLANSGANGVSIHLFEVYKKAQYTYLGEIELADKLYQEKQKGNDGKDRLAWVFPIKQKGKNSNYLPAQTLATIEKDKERSIKRLGAKTILERAETVTGKAKVRNIVSIQRERNPYVMEAAKIRAGGKCELCNESAPFIDKEDRPYLETHHIVWLSEDGDDTVNNTVALCPNCHRKMHIVKDRKDINKLKKVAENRL